MRLRAFEPFTAALILCGALHVGYFVVDGVKYLVEKQRERAWTEPIREPSGLERAHGYAGDFYKKHEKVGGVWRRKVQP